VFYEDELVVIHYFNPGKQVDGDGKFERISGTNVGGGTYWGLGRLLTKCERSFF